MAIIRYSRVCALSVFADRRPPGCCRQHKSRASPCRAFLALVETASVGHMPDQDKNRFSRQIMHKVFQYDTLFSSMTVAELFFRQAARPSWRIQHRLAGDGRSADTHDPIGAAQSEGTPGACRCMKSRQHWRKGVQLSLAASTSHRIVQLCDQ